MSVTTTTLAVADARPIWTKAGSYIELAKPRIAVLVLITVAVSAVLASGGFPDSLILLHTLIGTAIVAASASALNQWIEQDSDALMARTADRPLPSGRLGSREVLVLGLLGGIAGVTYLAALVHWQTALFGVLTWVLYVWVYTPLKSRTTLNTVVGAVAGAMPVCIGWSAVGDVDLACLSMFLLVYLWQFPHFMAIAWLYRKQYHQAGIWMLPVADPLGHRTGAQAVAGAMALLPVSLMPMVLLPVASLYPLGVSVLGLGQLACAAWFAHERSDQSARWLLRASLIYLPAVLLLLVWGPLYWRS